MTREEAISFLQDRVDLIDKQYQDIKDYREALVMAIKALKQQPCEDVMAIHTQGLSEGIRCAMCTNSIKSDRGCDGGCIVDEDMYKKVVDTIRNHIVPPATLTQKKGKWEQYGDFWKEKYRCSECKEEQPKILCGEQIIGHWSDYCPNCGAKMAENEEDKELIVNKDVYDTLTEEQKKFVDIGLSYFNNRKR